MQTLTHSPSTERNKVPILAVLQKYIKQKGRLLEIGSGTGEHAVYFAKTFQDIEWVSSDQKENHPNLKARFQIEKVPNLHGPEILKVGIDDFPKGSFDYVFTSNTLHIMSWKECKSFFKLLGKRLREGSLVFIYGPFNYEDQFTSESNQAFDQMLKTKNPHSGIRNFEDVLGNMKKAGFKLLGDHEMPANNRTLVFERLDFYQK